MYILSTDESYPNAYWFHYENEEPTRNDILNCKKIVCSQLLTYSLSKKISENKLLSYNYFYSGNGPDFISPMLASTLEENYKITQNIQLIDARVIVNKITLTGYKVINVLNKRPCIDLDKSIHKPLLNYIPDGPKKFDKIVLNNINTDIPIFRAAEHPSTIVVTEYFKDLCEKHNIADLRFLKEYIRNNR